MFYSHTLTVQRNFALDRTFDNVTPHSCSSPVDRALAYLEIFLGKRNNLLCSCPSLQTRTRMAFPKGRCVRPKR